MKKTVKVVGAVIRNEEGQILCALRSPEMSLPNMWEFPGGKIEEGEEPKEALAREIREELGCEISVGEFVERCVYEYPFAIVDLSCYEAAVVSGVPVAKEHAELVWKDLSELGELEWAPADVPIISEVKKAQLYLLKKGNRNLVSTGSKSN